MHSRDTTVLIDLLWFIIVHFFSIYYGPYSHFLVYLSVNFFLKTIIIIIIWLLNWTRVYLTIFLFKGMVEIFYHSSVLAFLHITIFVWRYWFLSSQTLPKCCISCAHINIAEATKRLSLPPEHSQPSLHWGTIIEQSHTQKSQLYNNHLQFLTGNKQNTYDGLTAKYLLWLHCLKTLSSCILKWNHFFFSGDDPLIRYYHACITLAWYQQELTI